MKIISRPIDETIIPAALIMTTAFFAGSERGIKLFNGASTGGLLFSGTLSSAACIGIDAFRHRQDSSPGICLTCLKTSSVFWISVLAPLPAKLFGERVTLSLLPSLKFGILKIGIILTSSTLFSFNPLYQSKQIEEETYTLYPHPLNLSINVVREDLKKNLKDHLKSLVKAFRDAREIAVENTKSNPFIHPNQYFTSLHVHFQSEPVADIGGGSREYLDELFSSLAKDEELFKPSDSRSLPLPSGRRHLSALEDLGEALMYLYHTPSLDSAIDIAGLFVGTNQSNYYTGNHFDNTLFQMALSFTAEELDTPFESLPNEVKVRILRPLIDGEIAYEHLQRNPDSEDAVDLFNSRIAPLHAFSKGMKAMCVPPSETQTPNAYWNDTIRRVPPLEMSTKIQGTLDREEVNRRIVLDENLIETFKPYIQERVTWMKEWIKDEATDLDLKQLLKFVTGSSSCPPGDAQIKVKAQGGLEEQLFMGADGAAFMPIPKASTCEMSMSFAPQNCGDDELNNHNKENFIKSLKAAISGECVFTVA